MKKSIFTALAVTTALMLPACASHNHGDKAASSEVQTERTLVSGDEASGNYVERVVETGPNFKKSTLITHSVETTRVPTASVKHPNATVRTFKERNVVKTMKNGKVHEEVSEDHGETVIPNN